MSDLIFVVTNVPEDQIEEIREDITTEIEIMGLDVEEIATETSMIGLGIATNKPTEVKKMSDNENTKTEDLEKKTWEVEFKVKFKVREALVDDQIDDIKDEIQLLGNEVSYVGIANEVE